MRNTKHENNSGLRSAVGTLLWLAGAMLIVLAVLGLCGKVSLEAWLSGVLLGLGILIFGCGVGAVILSAKYEHFTRVAYDREEEIDVGAASRKQTVGKVLAKIVIYLFLTLMAVVVIFPFYWMLISSVKTLTEYNATVPTLWPQKFRWETYLTAFTGNLHLGELLWHTVYVGVVSTILSLIVTILSAYAFARLEFRGKNAMFAAMLATMMIPGELFTVTNYITMYRFGWMNTFTALIVPFLVSVFYIYLLRQNFMQIPNELYLAAKVDGTSDLKYLWKVMIPLAAPTLISITLLKMMGAWNSYIWPKLVADDAAHMLITVGIRTADFSVGSLVDYPAQMAAVMLVTLPLLIVFIFFRKYIMRGVSRSGIKG